MEVIFRGAEAVVEKIEWQGSSAISKVRNKRSYRHPDLEKRLVTERLRSESRVIERLLSGGVLVPALYEVNVEKSQIIMEFLEGITLEKGLRTGEYKKYLVSTAKLLSQIHSLGIVHGDPTTSNFVISDDLYAIDFGLSTFNDDAESRASDLRVFLESLEAHHSEILGREIFLEAYSVWNSSKEVLEALEVLELRGRYNLMRG
ncbi:MAG: Kae1-associated kinase Bud32 [Euryarchaeota archaeon]|mgnify:FL=1|nr:Kae1-associated kinase Bud32 [Euryarchaeota archaeon]|tara:strand:+ start:23251 stop:23859 length:609 start_codon:yes stop_codon:yes gene_type:complete